MGLPPAAGAPAGVEGNDLYHCRVPMLHPPTEIRLGEAAVPSDPKTPESTESQKSAEPAADVGGVSIDCDPSLALRLVSSSSLGILESLRERLRLPGDPPSGVRLRIVLPDEDARRLFASLPSKILFFVSRVPAVPPPATAIPPR